MAGAGVCWASYVQCALEGGRGRGWASPRVRSRAGPASRGLRPGPRSSHAGGARSLCLGSGRLHPSERLVDPGGDTPGRHAPQGLGDDVAAHLAAAQFAFDEGDGHLDDAVAGADGAAGQVDLEAVALRLDVREAEAAQGRGAEGAETAGDVAQRDIEQEAGVRGAAAREEFAGLGPVDDATARDPAGAEDEVGVAQGGQEPGKLLGLVRAVRVHLDEDVEAVVEAPGETGEVGGAEPFLALAVQHLDVVVLGGESVGERARAVRAVVVRDEDVRRGHRLARPADDRPDVLRLVVRRDDHQCLAQWRALSVPAARQTLACVHCCPLRADPCE
ncbi:putative glycosyl transferase [Streptomyces sp. Tu6071]|nr:putative glycosyl transferase [Streptomyces sp. Tu6071]